MRLTILKSTASTMKKRLFSTGNIETNEYK